MEEKVVSLAELIKEGENTLKSRGIEAPRREALLLISSALRKSMSELLMMDRSVLVDPQLCRSFFQRRAQREPYAYITGEQGFWSLDIKVSSATLIPRADSEALIETLLFLRPKRQSNYQILDLGTGTGCLLLAALTEYTQAFGIGIDIVLEAVKLAVINGRESQLSQRSSFIVGHWGDALMGKFDIIFSNPPYICAKDIPNLMPEVRVYEPLSALDGGEDGMDAYRYICAQACHLLRKDGILIFEIGIHQDKMVEAIAESSGLFVVHRQQDLNGCIRAIALSPSKL